MMNIRKADSRGKADFGWLQSQHTFSFGSWHDPRFMGVGPLRVINEDRVAPGTGFDSHPHRDMEIITWVIEGALAHRDSMGNGSVIAAGNVQRMSAGTGVVHSEYNASESDPVHFLQIWIEPDRRGVAPGYAEGNWSEAQKRGRLALIASQSGRDGSLSLNQDADLYASVLKDGERTSHTLGEDRRGYLHVASGVVDVNGETLSAGDGVSIEGAGSLDLVSDSATEILLFDMRR